MDGALEHAVNAMSAGMARMDSISRNIANAQTPAYKRQIAVTVPFDRLVQEATSTAGGEAQATAPVAYSVDHRAGTLRNTGQTLDLALNPGHYLEVRAGNQVAFVRGGSLRLDEQGRLVTPAGDRVQGLGGDIVLSTVDVRIGANGQIHERGREVAQLKVVRIEEPGASLRAQGDLLVPVSSLVVAQQGNTNAVRQGFLENANVSVMTEMVRMVETVRHVESMQKVVQGYEQMMQTAVRGLGGL